MGTYSPGVIVVVPTVTPKTLELSVLREDSIFSMLEMSGILKIEETSEMKRQKVFLCAYIYIPWCSPIAVNPDIPGLRPLYRILTITPSYDNFLLNNIRLYGCIKSRLGRMVRTIEV